MLSLYQIEEAYKRISKFINKTPLINSDKLDKLTKSKIVIKAECLQKTGSFKIRGAINMISQIASDKVVAPSSGNHAQGVAAAAKIFNKSATLVMPEDAPKSKISGVKFYDGKIKSARFFANVVLPHVRALSIELKNADRSALDIQF